MTTLLTDSASSVPFFDGAPMMDGLKEDMLAYISALIDTGRFINGPDVAEFEALFAAYCQTAACVGAASGLDALRLALIASGLEQGDEVIVPAQTFIATFEALPQLGAADAYALARNSFDASFVDGERRRAMTERLDAAFARFVP